MTFKAKFVPEWNGVGRMEQSHAVKSCTLDTTEMKALDNQATAGSNTEGFELRKWRVSSLGRKLLRLMARRPPNVAAMEKCIEYPYYESSIEISLIIAKC